MVRGPASFADPLMLLRNIGTLSALTPDDGEEPPQDALPPPNEMAAILSGAERTTRDARAAEQAAMQQYQAAQGEAEPQVGPVQDAVATTLARLATTLGRGSGQDYSKQLQESTAKRSATWQAQHKANTERLRQTYENAAKRAAAAGDNEAEIKARQAIHKMDVQAKKDAADVKVQADKDAADEKFKNDKLLEGIKSTNRKSEDVAKARLGAGAAEDDEIATWAEHLAANTAQLPQVPRLIRGKVLQHMKANKLQIIPDATRKAIEQVSAAEVTVDEIERLSAQVNTQEPGLGAVGSGVMKSVGAFTKFDTVASDYAGLRGGLAGNLARAVGGERGVLTDQDRKWAMMLIPGLFDPAPLAASKIARLKRFLAYKRESAVRNFGTSDVTKKVITSNPIADGQRLAREGKLDELEALINENPELNDDPTIERLLKAAK